MTSDEAIVSRLSVLEDRITRAEIVHDAFLKAIDGKFDKINDRMDKLEMRLRSLEVRLAFIAGGAALLGTIGGALIGRM